MKFVDEVEHHTFSGPVAAERGKTVLYVTERCVFRHVPMWHGTPVEIAPGGPSARHPRPHGVRTVMRQPPVLMDARIFALSRWGCAPVSSRFRSSNGWSSTRARTSSS